MRDQFKMNILAPEYPGYGLLSGIPASEEALKEVVLTAFRFAVDELNIEYEQVILFGRSVGSGPTVWLASRYPVGGLILVAAFASVSHVVNSLVGGFLANAIKDRLPNISLIGNVSCPTLFVHGEKDDLVPKENSVALFKKCRSRKLLITPPSMEHNSNLFMDASYLAVPAINFFGLPGYQRENPPQMPSQFFEDGHHKFLQRKLSKQKANPSSPGGSQSSSSPWFMFCGCPTNKDRFHGPIGIHSPRNDGLEFEWEPESRADPTIDDRRMYEDNIGAPSTADRVTAAEAITVSGKGKVDQPVEPFAWGSTTDGNFSVDLDNSKKLLLV
jgi:dienelactone hydrolase